MVVICEQCGKSFPKPCKLKYHIDSVHLNIKNFSCPICSRAFGTLGKMLYHQHTHNDVREFTCEECPKRFKTRSDLYQHYEIHDKGKEFKCEECGEVMQKRSTFEVHNKKHVSGETTCKECFKEFEDYNRLKVHLWNNHKKDPQLECTICHKFFNRKLHLAKHLESHQRKELKQAIKLKGLAKSIQCTQCPRYFKNNKTLDLHVQKSHDNIPNFEYICDYCARSFQRKLGLLRHIRIHYSNIVKTNQIKEEDDIKDHIINNDKTLLEDNVSEDSLMTVCMKNSNEIENFILSDIKEETNPLMITEDEIKQEIVEYEYKTISDCAILKVKKEIVHDFNDLAMNDSSLGSVEDASILEPLVKIEPVLRTLEAQNYNLSFSEAKEKFNLTEIKCFPCESCEESFITYENLRHHYKKEHLQQFQCETCDKSFEFYSRLQRHIKSVHQPKVKEHKCELCDKAFPNLDLMNRHVRRIHKKMLDHKCTFCDRGFHTRMELEKHSLKSTDCSSNMEYCETCHKSFTDLRKLEIHKVNEHSVKKEAFCSLCEFRGSRMKLKEHSLQEHNIESKYDCEACLCSFSAHQSMNRHRLEMHGLKDPPTPKFPCSLCSQSFKNRTNLKRHVQSVHEKLARHTCPICEEGFLTAYHLTKHSKRVHKDGLKLTRTCGVCQQEFLLAKAFYDHIEHHQEAHICKMCGDNHKDDKALEEHLKIHRKIDDIYKKFVCDSCGLRFTIRSHLMVHMMQHIDDKIYTCDTCGKTCKAYSNLLKHKKIHNKEIECEICKKMFATKQSLELHSRSHSNYKPYSCHICNATFAVQASYKYHMQKHDGSLPQFPCAVCFKNFDSKFFMKSHMLQQHSKNFEFRCETCFEEFKFMKQLARHKETKCPGTIDFVAKETN